MKEEMLAIERNDTWELIDAPKDKNVIRLKWVFRTKYNVDGSIQKHKAQLVAKGYPQQQGIDFHESFSPIARFEIVRLMLTLAAQFQLLVYQPDVKSAFLNGTLEEEVYVPQPQGFIVNVLENKVYKLKKAFYELKQTSRAWYSRVEYFFQANKFTMSENEPTLYFKREDNGTNFLLVCLYVDDIIYMGSKSLVVGFMTSMMKTFEMTDLALL